MTRIFEYENPPQSGKKTLISDQAILDMYWQYYETAVRAFGITPEKENCIKDFCTLNFAKEINNGT